MLAKEIEGINNNESLRIENVTYKNNIIQQTMFNYLSNTNFFGISVSRMIILSSAYSNNIIYRVKFRLLLLVLELSTDYASFSIDVIVYI